MGYRYLFYVRVCVRFSLQTVFVVERLSLKLRLCAQPNKVINEQTATK